MKNQKGLPAQAGISSSVGILIIIIIAIIAFGGVFAYQYFSPKTQPVVQTQDQNIQTAIQSISDDMVIAALNKLNGFQLVKNVQGNYSADAFGGTYNVITIAKGDLNGDKLQDAVVQSLGCGASCGSIFTIVINKGGNLTDAFNVVPEGVVLSSAIQSSIESITIDNNIISMSVINYQANGSTNPTFTYKLIGKNLVKF